jgi:hypothetical protein
MMDGAPFRILSRCVRREAATTATKVAKSDNFGEHHRHLLAT